MLSTRLLYIVPRDAQLEQFVADGPRELAAARVSGPLKISDIRNFSLAKLLREHRKNECQVFAITVQSLCEKRGYDVIKELMTSGIWMTVVDEYHHYGLDKQWGRAAIALPHSFLLAMSATPYRPYDDSAFPGEPDVTVSYRDAAIGEKCLKPLHGHAYHYRIDTLDGEGNVTSYTTEELASAAGSDAPDAIEAFRIERKMRWSPKYVSPLVRVPIERLEPGCQALVSAMCVSHAKLICEQLCGMFPELRIDWVGTGTHGRANEENDAVIKKFCPPKNDFGIRVPELDVLVHVGIAGEGLDATHISEVMFLRPASPCNQDHQIIGRGSRVIYGREITCHISFDASTQFAYNGYIGDSIMDAIDGKVEPQEKNNSNPEPDYPEPPELPSEPDIRIFDMELLRIDSGDSGVQRMAEVLEHQHHAGYIKDQIDAKTLKTDLTNPQWDLIRDIYLIMRKKEADVYNEIAIAQQWREAVDAALRNITGLTLSMMFKNGARIEKSLIGDVKKRLNTQKKKICGSIENDIATCRRHYTWLEQLGRELRSTEKLPTWLE
jgi:superfamily II DNA or RNA helicase